MEGLVLEASYRGTDPIVSKIASETQESRHRESRGKTGAEERGYGQGKDCG
jgi:hypothetical protein